MPDIDLDRTPKTVRVEDLVGLLGEAEARRLLAGLLARKAMPQFALTAEHRSAVLLWLDPTEPVSPREGALVAEVLRVYLHQGGTVSGPSARRRATLRAWLARQADGESAAPPRATRRRRRTTDPAVIAKRNEALAKARAVRQERIAQQRAEAS